MVLKSDHEFYSAYAHTAARETAEGRPKASPLSMMVSNLEDRWALRKTAATVVAFSIASMVVTMKAKILDFGIFFCNADGERIFGYSSSPKLTAFRRDDSSSTAKEGWRKRTLSLRRIANEIFLEEVLRCSTPSCAACARHYETATAQDRQAMDATIMLRTGFAHTHPPTRSSPFHHS